jgi:hypothetical protein
MTKCGKYLKPQTWTRTESIKKEIEAEEQSLNGKMWKM